MYMARMGYSETIQPKNRDSDTTQKDNDEFLQLSIARFKGWDCEQLKSSARTRDSPEIAMVCSRTPSN